MSYDERANSHTDMASDNGTGIAQCWGMGPGDTVDKRGNEKDNRR